MDLYPKAISIMCIIFISVIVLITITGCDALIKGVGSIVGINRDVPTDVPDTPKKQLWETIKGLTPNWLAIPVIALGAVAMFNGAVKLGWSCIIFGSVNLFMALATSRFGFWMALCGLVASMAAVAMSILAKNTAIRELIFNNQCIKQVAKDDNVDLVFQDKIKERLAKQVKSTKKIVKNVKDKMKLKGVI